MKKLTAILIFILNSAICFSQIIHVPDDYNTIQLGINAANTGDTVLVEQGVYYENINFMGKGIFIASHYIFEADSAHIYNTIIDGSQPTDPEFGSVVTFDSNTDTTSCLLGFTIKGGAGTKTPFIFPICVGGGIIFNSAGGKIENNIIENNACILDTLDGGVYGGGIGSGPPLEDHLIVIRKNIIQNNIAWTKGSSTIWNMGWAEGGGIYLCYNAIVEGNQIDLNLCTSNSTSGGGAISIDADPEFSTYEILVEVRNNLIRNNQSKSETAGAFAGGISCSVANTIIENNTITGNSVESQNYCRGAGLYFKLVNSYYAKLNNNYISNNFSLGGVSDGGAIGLFQSIDIEICNNIILNNSADKGGAFSINSSQPELICNNTIINNTATEEGGSFYIYENSAVEIFNSILRDNNANGFPNEINFETGSIVWIEYSNIEGEWLQGNENIDEDPLFEDIINYDYHILVNSPCIDSGDPSLPDDPDGTTSDIGALYFDQRPIEALAATEITGSSFLANWEEAEEATSYLLDLAYDTDFNNYVEGYQKLEVGNVLSYIIEGLTPFTNYYYRVRANYYFGRSGYSNTIMASTITSINKFENQSTKLKVYPNPVIINSSIEFSVFDDGFVNLYLIDLSGKKIEAIITNKMNPGQYQFELHLEDLKPGIYICVLKTSEGIQTRKIIKID